MAKELGIQQTPQWTGCHITAFFCCRCSRHVAQDKQQDSCCTKLAVHVLCVSDLQAGIGQETQLALIAAIASLCPS